MSKSYSKGTIGGVDLADLVLDNNNRKKNAAILAAGYTPLKRRFEIAVISTFITLLLMVGWRAIVNTTVRDLWIVLSMFVVGQVFTDFISGLIHWACDTWGKLDTPVVGPTFIRSFREHHVDPTAMCNHDFIETNADASLPSVAVSLYLVAWHGFRPGSSFDLCFYYFAFFGGFFAALTNEFHKWSHYSAMPSWIATLQYFWIVLPKRHHGTHHKPPFDKYYCITTGHLNYVLDGIDFWRKLERCITALTGAVPREDDKLWTGQIYGTATTASTAPVETSVAKSCSCSH